MSEPAGKKGTYGALYTIPENMTGEIIGGWLIVTPRPSRQHILASSFLGSEMDKNFHNDNEEPETTLKKPQKSRKELSWEQRTIADATIGLFVRWVEGRKVMAINWHQPL